MAEEATKKIGFLKTMETNCVDNKKLDTIESLRTKANEFDDRILKKESIHQDGKLYPDVIPVVFNH